MYGLTESDLAAARETRSKYMRVLRWSEAAGQAKQDGQSPVELDPELLDWFRNGANPASSSAT